MSTKTHDYTVKETRTISQVITLDWTIDDTGTKSEAKGGLEDPKSVTRRVIQNHRMSREVTIESGYSHIGKKMAGMDISSEWVDSRSQRPMVVQVTGKILRKDGTWSKNSTFSCYFTIPGYDKREAAGVHPNWRYTDAKTEAPDWIAELFADIGTEPTDPGA